MPCGVVKHYGIFAILAARRFPFARAGTLTRRYAAALRHREAWIGASRQLGSRLRGTLGSPSLTLHPSIIAARLLTVIPA